MMKVMTVSKTEVNGRQQAREVALSLLGGVKEDIRVVAKVSE